MSAFLSPIFGAGFQAFNNTGGVLAGGKLYTYQAGSTTAQATWTTSLQSVPNANPVVFDSAGRYADEIWLQGGSTYKFVLTDSSGSTLGTWDNIGGVNDASYAGFSEWVTYGVTPTYLSTTSFSVPGDQTGIFQVGRRVQASVSGGTVYGSVLTSVYSSVTTVTLTMDSTNLDSSLFSVAYGFMSGGTNTSLPVSFYAPINSPTFTGTPSAPTPAQTVSTTQLATTAFVQTLVTNSITPSGGAAVWVSGTTYAVGNLVYSPINFQTYRRKIAGDGTTDPSADGTNWALTGMVVGSGGTTTTGSVTLVASSAAAVTVTPASAGLYVTLPDATTCNKGVPLFSIYNAGDYDYGIKNSAGTQLGWVRARTGAVIGLSDSSTAAGVWATYGVQKLGVTASLVDTTIAVGSSPSIKRIALDSNRTLFLVGNSSVYAVVYDASTQTWGAPALIRATIAASAYQGVLCATDKVLVCTNDSTTGMQTVVLSVSTNTVTAGTPVSTTLAGNWDRYGQFVAVGSSFVLAYSRASTVAALRVFTVSGTTPTVGSETIVHSTAATGEGAPPQLFVSGSICRTINYLNTGNFSCKPYTIATTVATVGTEATAATTSTSSERKAFLNTAGNIVLVHTNTTVKATIFKLNTGTVTEAVSTASLNAAGATSAAYVDYINVSATKTVICVAQNAIIYSNILTDTSGTASAGTAITQTANNNIVAICAATYSGNYARFAVSMASKRGQLILDTSSSSPSLASMQYVDGSGTYSFGVPFPRNFATDNYSGSALLAGASLYSNSGTTATQSDLVFAASGIAAVPPHLMYTVPYGTGGYYDAAGATRSETWIIEQQTTTGAKISRVEAAE